MIIDRFDSLHQFYTFKQLNKKFHELVKDEKIATLYFSQVKKMIPNHLDFDWKKLLRTKTDQCSHCSKKFKEKEFLKIYYKKIENQILNFYLKIPQHIFCEICSNDKNLEIDVGLNHLFAMYKILGSEKKNNFRILISQISIAKFLVSLNKDALKKDVLKLLFKKLDLDIHFMG